MFSTDYFSRAILMPHCRRIVNHFNKLSVLNQYKALPFQGVFKKLLWGMTRNSWGMDRE